MKLLEEYSFKNVLLRNRMVVPPMVTNFANEDGSPTERFMAYYEEKAKGGWGLIIVEDFAINPTAGGFKRLPALYHEGLVAQYRVFTERIHRAGAKVMAQIYHAGRRTIPEFPQIAPSAIGRAGESVPRALDKAEILALEEDFVNTAQAAWRAGFDGVEVHGAHGYLLNQFTSAAANKRSDCYGGSVENRVRFSAEVVAKIRASVPESFIVGYRMTSVEYTEGSGGLSIEESKAMAMILEQAGVDIFDVSQGSDDGYTVIPPSCAAPACYIDNAKEIKSVVNVPVIGVGRINSPAVAESILVSGKADLVIMGRASIADPHLPEKIASGRWDEIMHCIGCVQGCIGQNRLGNAVRCLVNPLTGRESECDLTPLEEGQRVYVAGGGVAGCEAAITAAIKGHQVTLFEQAQCLGGQWIAASMPPGKAEFASLITWQAQALDRAGVTVKLNTALTAEMIQQDNPDVVIAATGSKPFVPSIKGIEGDNVFLANDVLLGEKTVGVNVVVIGGGMVGAETALYLALQGKKVIIVEMLEDIAMDGEPNVNHYLKAYLKQYGVAILTSAKVVEISGGSVVVEGKNGTQTVSGMDAIVLAAGGKSYRPLPMQLPGYRGKLIAVGDARQVKNGYYNIQEAFEAALAL